MSIKKGFNILAYKLIISFVLAGIVTGCSSPANLSEAQSTPEKQNIEEQEQIVKPTNTTTFCPTIKSRNWHAWIDRVAENKPRLVVSGEVDLPTPGYEVRWQAEILDRLSSNGGSQPLQRLSISFTPPDGIVTQVITPTEVSFTMPSLLLEYSSVMIYCGDKLLADLPDVVPTD